MTLIDSLLDSIENDGPVQSVQVGPFMTAVLAGACGLSSTQRDEAANLGCQGVTKPGSLNQLSAARLARLLKSELLLEASIGMAALNALIKPDLSSLEKSYGQDYILRKVSGRRLTVIGHFPFVERLKGQVKKLYVLEKNPKFGDLAEDETAKCLEDSDAVVITGTAIINHTIDKLLEQSRGIFTMVMGPSAPLSPVLFDYGADAIAGAVVVDAERVVRQVGEGAVNRRLEGVERVIMVKE